MNRHVCYSLRNPFYIGLFRNKWDIGLWAASKRGKSDLAKLMIEQGATRWKMGLKYACREGHKDMALLMIKLSAQDWVGGCHTGIIQCINKRRPENCRFFGRFGFLQRYQRVLIEWIRV